jgi:hypothetical protein
MEKLVLHITKEAAMVLDPAEEIAKGMTIVRDGTVVHDQVAAAVTTKTKEKELAA